MLLIRLALYTCVCLDIYLVNIIINCDNNCNGEYKE